MAKRATKKDPSGNVRVRMYRQGLGDCFLLSFPSVGEKPFHVLIDCGVCKGAKNASARMQEVVADIATETNSKLDVLVTTHEHWDHLSGFEQAKDVWADIAIGELWMAWTEKKGDHMADAVFKELGKKKKKVEDEAVRMAASPGLRLNAERSGTIQGLLGFHGLGLSAAGGGAKLEDIYARVKKKVDRHKHFMPHTVHTDARMPGVKVFVLGPPYDVKKIAKSDPDKRAPEVYPETQRAFGFTDAGSSSDLDFTGPFAATEGISIGRPPSPAELRLHPTSARPSNQEQLTYEEAFKKHFDAIDKGVDADWRRLVDDDFADFEQLAMALVRDTNNTSLALAFQLPDGRVLLFPGDAQVGNCLSWHDADFKVGTKKVSAAELLKNTVLYKVSHHCSHNGTLKDQGLEQMIHRDLIALVPLEVSQAASLGYARTMPWPSLVSRLKERTKGRMLLSDSTRKAPSDTDLKDLSDAARTRFDKTVSITPLYIDVTL
ncbi:MAG: hypothetical protein IPK99_16860 [Flavobacteriales bacterium]|nr:hypothetical protein [Flavobacteriales bacterium]